jgi:hypothetical protein
MEANKSKQNGSAIILAMMIISILLFMSIFFLNLALTERKIARSHAHAQRTYYLAESGVNEAIWRIKNDPDFRLSFLYDGAWATSTTRLAPFGNTQESYTVEYQNDSPAHSVILSTGHLDLGNGMIVQRKIRTFIYQAVGETGIEDNGGYADGNIDISSSVVNFNDGSAHSNNNFIINTNSTVNVDSDLDAVGNYNEHWTANVNVSGSIHAANVPPAAAEIEMPAVDFNSAAADSLKNRATVIYTTAQFETLMQNNQNLVLNDPIIYVAGDVAMKGAQTITLNNSLLVVERDFTIGFKNNWGARNGPSTLHINHATGTPSGVLAARHINIWEYTDTIKARGLIYANNTMDIRNLNSGSTVFEVTGALIARKLTISSCWDGLDINYDAEIISSTIGSASTSPTIIVEHWEEEY